MAETPEAPGVDYGKYLDANPTQLMVHIEKWLKEKSGFDPKTARTKDEAFATGVYLTVHLRGVHQASEENQARLLANRQAADAADAAKAEARSEKAALRAAKVAPLAEETAAPKRRGRAKATEVIPEVPAAEPAAAPKRRGRPRKVAAEPAEAPPENVTPIRRRAAKATATAEPAAEVKKPVRRRAVRQGEAAF